MTTQPVPQGVNLLKELLFDRENRRLDELTRRLEADASASEARAKSLGDRIDVVFERAGTEERLLRSVAVIIDGALREAEISRHEPLSKAIAPLIVSTIKAQLKESQDEMVDALYPITGRLVKAYVQAEINKRMLEINARLGGGRPAQLTAESAATGVPVEDLALAAANKLEVEEVFLVRRGSGDLIAHWEKSGAGQAAEAGTTSAGSNRDVLLSGYLSGIMTLSEEAFGAEPGSFRTLTFASGDRIFVRGSAAHLLAVRCTGSAPVQVEQVIDEVFLDTLERYQKVLAADALRARETGSAVGSSATTRAAVTAILPAVARSIEKQAAERTARLRAQQAAERKAAAPSFTRVYALAALLAAPFILWGLWSAYQSFETMRTESAVNSVLATIDDIRGMPPKIEIASGGRALTLSGFVASAAIRDQLLTGLRQNVPQAVIRNQLTVLPQTSAEIEAALTHWQREAERARQDAAATAVARALVRVRQRLQPLQATVAKLEQTRGDAAAQPALSELHRVLDAAMEQARPVPAGSASQAQLEALWQSATRADELLSSLMGAVPSPARPIEQRPLDAQQLAEECSLLAEHLSAIGFGLPLPATVTALTTKVERLRAPTARDELEQYARSNAIFFGNGTDFRDSAVAMGIIDQLVRRLRDNPEVILRIVGYTDDRGSALLNTNLAQTRADRVASLLAERGASPNRVVAVGRLAAKDLSRTVGAGSANRRVEFELGFPGEADGGP